MSQQMSEKQTGELGQYSQRYSLSADELPRHWYNAAADLPFALSPPLNPVTKQPVSFEDMSRIFAPQLIEQEMSTQRYVEIPEEVRGLLSTYRPTPLIRARGFERAVGSSSKIYYKHEGVSPAGSHKPNSAIAQAYFNKIAGVKRLVTETGAGQWGSSLAYACQAFGMDCRVYMVRISYEQKPYRRTFMRLFGAEVFASPSTNTRSGRAILQQDASSPGSLGIAISEAVEEAIERDDTNYALGSVLNHVLLHQTVIGLEAKRQLELLGETPDFIFGAHGGGSNFGGIALPFVPDIVTGKKIQAIAVEPNHCPTLTQGSFAYDYGDTAGLTPMMQMYTLGKDFMPPPDHAGGLRYHGASPLVSALVHHKLFGAQTVEQREVFKAAALFARSEGIVPAPESAHAIAAVKKKAEQLTEEGKESVLLFSLSGHGFLDLGAYEAFLNGGLED